MLRIRKQSVVLCLFILGSGAVVLSSFLGDWDGGIFHRAQDFREDLPNAVEESYFERASFYLQRDDAPMLQLDAQELMIDEVQGRLDAVSPLGVAFSEGRQTKYRARSGTYNREGHHIRLTGDVEIVDGNSTFASGEAHYHFPSQTIRAQRGVTTRSFLPKTRDRVVVRSDYLVSDLRTQRTIYQGKAHGNIVRRRVYEEGIHFSSSEITVDIPGAKVDLLGEVGMRKNTLTATSNRGEIFLENYNKKLKYLALYDSVELVEKIPPPPTRGGEALQRLAYSEQLEFIVAEGKIFLTGDPKVIQEDNIIKGNIITLRESNNTVEVEDANSNFQLRHGSVNP